MKKYISMIIKVLIFASLLSMSRNMSSGWHLAPQVLLCIWFGWMIAEQKILNEEIKKAREVKNRTWGLMKFQCWDKEKKKFWGDFRIHPQGFVAPATKEKDGHWVYNWDYDQSKLELYTSLKIDKKI